MNALTARTPPDLAADPYHAQRVDLAASFRWFTCLE